VASHTSHNKLTLTCVCCTGGCNWLERYIASCMAFTFNNSNT